MFGTLVQALEQGGGRMNNDLISRKALRKQFGYTDEWYKSRTVAQIIDNAPTVEQNWRFYYDHGYKQAERDLKRPTGEWIDEGQYAEGHSEHAYICKNCGYQIIENPSMIFENRYCKCCGADMRKETENEDSN